MNLCMVRLARLGALVLVASGACSPEVVIAHREPAGAGAGMGGSDAPAGGSSSEGGDSAHGGEGDSPAGGSGDEADRILADSVADFSLTQGDYGWYYGWDGGSVDSFQQLTRIATITAFEPPTKDMWDCWASDNPRWTQLFQLGGHPNGTDSSPPAVGRLERAVRRWLSTYQGDVVIVGEAAKIDLVGSNGVDIFVYVDGVQLHTDFIGGDDGAGLSYEVRTSLRVGSTVDFVLDAHEGSDHHDLSRFTATISRDLHPR
jgi:hypothetical protein